jgi:integrase
MKLGNITKRGKSSWRIKIELERDPVTGKRRHYWETVTGTREKAKEKLVELRNKMRVGERIEPSDLTVETYLRSWLAAPAGLTPKTAERYRQLSEQQIIPHLGAIALHKLGAGDVQDWHVKLLASGGKDGRALNARTVGHAHRLLHHALERALQAQRVFRNVASIVKPPKVEEKEIEILTAPQIVEMLEKIRDHDCYSLAVTAIGTGLRRGELLALQWSSVDLERGSLRVERSVEHTKGNRLRFKPPKSKSGRRSVSLPPFVIEVLRVHRKQQLEQRVALGLGKPADDALVFCHFEGSPILPDRLSWNWARLVRARGLPRVTFHGLRHSHVSALIAGGLDVFSVSRRIGHSSAGFTLKTYTHLFSQKDAAADAAIEAALRPAPAGKEAS